MNSRLLLISICLLLSSFMFAQSAAVQGTVSNKDGSAKLIAKVTLKKEGEADKVVITGDDGAFVFLSLTNGSYIIKVEAPGFETVEQGFSLSTGATKNFDIRMNVPVKGDLGKVIVAEYKGLDPSEPDITIRPEEAYTNPGDITTTLALDPNIIKTRNGIQFTGRPEQTAVFQGGVTQLGPLTPLTLNLGQVRAISGGVPAMYGDFTGGAIEITTASTLSQSSQFTFQLNSSQFFNPYNQNSLETNWYTPLKRNDAGVVVMGFSHSMYVSHERDPNPFNVPLYYIKQNLIDSLNNQPFEIGGSGTELPGYFFYKSDDLQQSRVKQDASSLNFYNQLNFQFNPGPNLQFGLQSSFQYTRRRVYSFSNSLFNSEHNPLLQTMTGKLNFQMSHQLIKPFDEKGKRLYTDGFLSALNYQLILDYQRYNAKQTDPIYGDNIFEYGYLGAFSTQGEQQFEYVEQASTFKDQNGREVYVGGYYNLVGYSDTALNFAPASLTDSRSSFTRYLMNRGDYQNYSELQRNQGLLNGQNPNNVYSLWYAPGTVLSNYSKTDIQKSSALAIVNMAFHPTRELSYRHDLQFGLLFENRSQSNYSLSANGLWILMPQLVNRQFVKLDTDNPFLSYDAQGVFTDTIYYDWLVDGNSQTQFDSRLRAIVDENNGHQFRNAHFIDVQSVDPNQLSLSMFSADELLNNGNSYVSYSGYDYMGNLQRGNVSLNDFLLDPANRAMGAFNPLYTALWIQDKFAIDEINFRAGVRIERYDANQHVLADPFSLYPVRTAAEVTNLGEHPSTIGDDFAVYVDDMNSPQKIAGYRNGRQWYDAKGNEVNSPEVVRNQSTSGRIQPYLVDPSNQKLTTNSFKDYSPEILILPRLSFSFPISGSAVFYAYYDQFAQRPNSGQSFSPISNYFYLQNRANRIIANPDLKPSKRTDYQVGFKQMLGNTSSINLTAKYAEIRDDINLVRMEEAYPVSYTTYGNIDFSTIKSFKVEYESRLKNIYMRVNYMLQYADGTGSNVNSQQALIASNQPNLRSLYPLEYDVRHKIGAYVSVDLYELGEVLCSPVFKNASVNILFNTQSGTPFTAYQQAVPEAQNLGVASRSQIKGNPYGSRLPWNSSLDISVIKRLQIGGTPFEIQLNAQNLLNTLNIFDLYAYSGLAGNDGYLSSPAGQQQLRNEVDAEAFAYLYSLKQLNPGHFGLPRMISITCRASF